MDNQLPEKVSCGVPGLDVILEGGFVKGGVYLLLGPPGSGKTILANQICFNQVRKASSHVVYVTLLAESHSRMMENLRPLKWFDSKLVSECIHYMSGYQALEKEGLRGFLKLIAGIVREKNASVLMIDGMSTIGELDHSPITFRKFTHELNSYLSTSGCTSFLLSSNEGHLARPEHTMVDGIISLHYQNIEQRVVREIEVRKFRGSGHVYGRHFYKIGPAGIEVFPRLECLFQPKEISTADKKLQFGIAGLDKMLGGGVAANSITTFLGSAGTGKTSVGLQFLAAGVQAGEKGLFFGFYERPPELIQKTQAMNFDISQAVAAGKITLSWHPALEHEIDELAYHILNMVETHRIKRLVIDGVDGLKHSSSNKERVPVVLTALLMKLKCLGVAVFLIEEVSLFGTHLERQIGELSAINENLFFGRHMDVDDQLIKVISLIKIRNAKFDHKVRILEIDDQGIRVEDSIKGPETILTNRGRSF